MPINYDIEYPKLQQKCYRLQARIADLEGFLHRFRTPKESMLDMANRIETLEVIKCPDHPKGLHRWNGDGQCLDCCNYATDLNDQALTATDKGETDE